MECSEADSHKLLVSGSNPAATSYFLTGVLLHYKYMSRIIHLDDVLLTRYEVTTQV